MSVTVRQGYVTSLVKAKNTGCPLEMYVRLGQEKTEQIHRGVTAYLNTKQKSQYNLAQVQK